MLERVALAIWRAREATFPAFTQRMTPDDLDRASGAWGYVVAQARAAIAEMREPTFDMVKAGLFDIRPKPIASTLSDQMEAEWRAMIDNVLAEPNPGIPEAICPQLSMELRS